ncbi:MAG TPA: DUF4388 domain-containing protein, partial [Verrucomicrobiae bacterium]|nr:DUF4388 domain-containing protein [Verrucomicrobiae bacterium]
IFEGDIIHAESGSMQGEVALYGILGLRGGEFNLRPYAEPARRTISGHYEFLLMEAARLSDEGANPLEAGSTTAVEQDSPVSRELDGIQPEAGLEPQMPLTAGNVQIQETVLCSGSGSVLYEWQSPALEQRLRLMKHLDTQCAQLSQLLPAGFLDRVEFLVEQERIVCQLQPDMRLFVRSRAESAAVP